MSIDTSHLYHVYSAGCRCVLSKFADFVFRGNDMFVLESLNSFVMNLVSVPICVNFAHFWFCVLRFFLPYSFPFI
jgi:hypothetical protein